MDKRATPQIPVPPLTPLPNPAWLDSHVWHTVLDRIPGGLVAVDAHGKIVHCNAYATLVLGLAGRSVQGRHFGDVFCPSLPLASCWVAQALDLGQARRNHRFQLEHPSGPSLPLEADLSPLRDGRRNVVGALVAVRTLDEPPGLEAAHQSARSTAVDCISDGLMTVDPARHITSFNRAAERLTGLRERDVLGRPCQQVLQTDRCGDACPLAVTLQHAAPQFGCRVTLAASGPTPVAALVNTVVLRDERGAPMGGVVTFRDADLYGRVDHGLATAAQFEGLVGRHPRMQEVYELIAEVADSDASVLIMGESGTGKQMVAQALVARSRRRGGPFIKVSCSVYPDTLLESELFGYVRGAFTDARQDRVGRFVLADRGTVFLDEIGEISPAAQVKLLRVLEERAFEPLGTSHTTTVDVRIIAATNRDLPTMVRQGGFRSDLFYRLNVIQVTLPPLRDRRSDIPLLAEHFLAKYRLLTGQAIQKVSQEAMDALTAHDYPGNVRELENAIQHAFARTRGPVIEVDRLPLGVRLAVGGATQARVREDGERERIVAALTAARWNRDRAARSLGVSRTTLWRRLRALGLDLEAGP